MALSDVTLVNKAAANVVFSFQSMLAQNKVQYSDPTQLLTSPRILTLGHQAIGKGVTARDRHMIRLDVTKLDEDGVSAYTLAGYTVWDVPRRVFIANDVYDVLAMLKSAMTEANFAKLLANQYL